MPDSPITAVLQALDALDAGGAAAGFAPTATLTTIDGRTVTGIADVRATLAELVGNLRATHHDVTAQWNPEPGVWVAELTAAYELRDSVRLGPYRRAMVARQGPDGIIELTIYGAHELPLIQAEQGYREVYAGGHWMPTL